MRKRLGDRGGWTLVEVLVATTVTAALAAMGYGFAAAALAASRLHAAKSEALEGVATTLDLMARELRMAGERAANAACAACEGIRVAEATRLRIDADINTDGDVADANEVIEFSYDAAARQVERRTGAGSSQPLLRNVPADGLRFAYYDAAGNALSAAGGLDAATRSRVRRIDVALAAEAADLGASVAGSARTSMSTAVCLRNR